MLNLRHVDRGSEPGDELSYFTGPALHTLAEGEEDAGDVADEQQQCPACSDLEIPAGDEQKILGGSTLQGEDNDMSEVRHAQFHMSVARCHYALFRQIPSRSEGTLV